MNLYVVINTLELIFLTFHREQILKLLRLFMFLVNVPFFPPTLEPHQSVLCSIFVFISTVYMKGTNMTSAQPVLTVRCSVWFRHIEPALQRWVQAAVCLRVRACVRACMYWVCALRVAHRLMRPPVFATWSRERSATMVKGLSPSQLLKFRRYGPPDTSLVFFSQIRRLDKMYL